MKLGDENLPTNDNNTDAHLIKSTSRRLRRLVIVKKMRSAAVSPNRNLVNGQRKKSRDGREIATSEARKHLRKFKTKMEEEEAGPPSSSSSSSSGRCEGKRAEAKPLGVIVAGCEGEGEEESSVACLCHGFISVIGRRRVMEDAVTVAPGFVGDDEFGRCDFFAVYDGHGGAKVANACRDRMHQLVSEEVAKGRRGGGVLGKGVEYWEKVMAASFERMDAEVSGGEAAGIGDQGDTLKTVGSTAVMVVVGKEEMVAANCGDSRAVLCTRGIAVPLSHDHKVI